MKKKKIVVLSGAGISAESGIPTFRGADGLWEGHRVEDVASPEGWYNNKALVLDFYNQRRKKALEVSPNNGHQVLVALEEHFDVQIITQNVDNLHERAGSTKVMHLHGELFKSRSTQDPSLIYDINGWELKEGDLCEKGSQLRPHIVWFGEAVPMIDPAIQLVMLADFIIVVGTSLAVYPAAGLIDYAPPHAQLFVVDPHIPHFIEKENIVHKIPEPATTGLEKVKRTLLELISPLNC